MAKKKTASIKKKKKKKLATPKKKTKTTAVEGELTPAETALNALKAFFPSSAIPQAQPELEIVVRGNAVSVRRALQQMQFGGWDQGIARQIALDQTGVADANLDDELGGPKIALFSEEVRRFYRDSCCREAARLGHPVDDPDEVASEKDTTVMEVGDTLYAAAKP